MSTTRDPSLVVAFVCKVGHLSDSDTAKDLDSRMLVVYSTGQ